MRPISRFILLFIAVLAAGACARGDLQPADQNDKSEAAASASPLAPEAAATGSFDAPGDGKAKKGSGGKSGSKAETWKRSQVLPNASKLMVGDRESLALRGMQVLARIDGFRARVVIDYFYANASSQSYEGTFKMRLPNGASPYFFAFGETSVVATSENLGAPVQRDFAQAQKMGVGPAQIMDDRKTAWSLPKEARMVPREKAARAYADTVRQRVDPALMEWSGPGMFSARVFPLQPGKLHRIVVGYDVDLLAVGGALVLDVDLPEDVPHQSVHFDIANPSGTRITLPAGAQTLDGGGRRHARFDQPKNRTLRARIEGKRPWLLTGSDEATGAYFAGAFEPQLPKSTTTTSAKRGVLLIDTSLSSNPDKLNVWLKLAEAILTDNRASMREFSVLFFNVEASWWRTKPVKNTAENVERLLADANQLVLEGATDLGAALTEAASPAWARDADLFLLSDGASTWGERNLYAMSRSLHDTTLFAYRTGMAGSDDHALTHLARESGGAVFSVVSEAEVKTAAVAHRTRPWRITKVAVSGADDVMLAGRPTTVFAGQRLVVVGRGNVEGAIALTLEQGNRSIEVKTQMTALASSLTPRTYGAVAVNQLEDLAVATEEIATAYASHFRVTGKTCSLLMLETEEDYRRHNIEPQQDALVVKSRPASKTVQNVLQETQTQLGDPKVGFMAWLAKMEKTPGVKLTLPTALRVALEDLPTSAFVVPASPLRVEQRVREGIPAEFLRRLAGRQIDYDAFTAEAERRRASNGAGDALKAFSSLVENSPGDGVLARDIAFYAMQHGLDAQAYHLLRRVADARPYEPQTYMALARAAARTGRTELAMAYYEVGLGGAWDARFGEFARILELDYYRLLKRIASGEAKTQLGVFAASRLGTMGKKLDTQRADVVVVIMWNTDNTDIDLHVVEPSGEECFYSHPTTKSGGRLTRDVTQGYGPEMYTLAKAPKGTYEIRAKYFASDQNRASTRTKVHAMVFENWGMPNETVTEKVVTLERGKDMHSIATVQR